MVRTFQMAAIYGREREIMPLIFFGTITIDPASAAIGDTITIDNTGAGFFDTMVVTVDGVPADSIAVDTGHGNGQQRITCDIPTGAGPGAVDVYVENPDGENATITGALTIPDATTQRNHMAVGIYIGM